MVTKESYGNGTRADMCSDGAADCMNGEIRGPSFIQRNTVLDIFLKH